MALDIRSTTDWEVRRTEISRALVAALITANIGLAASRSEADVTATVVQLMKAER